MVTGALLLDKSRDITYQKLFKKYIFRILIALAMACMVLEIVDMVLAGDIFSVYTVFEGAQEFFSGTSWAYLWYLYLLIGLYLFLPFYKKIVSGSKEYELKYLTGLYILFLSLIPILNIWDIKCGFYITTASIYPLFLFLGYMFHEKIIYIGKIQSIAFIICATIILISLTVIRWQYNIPAMDILLGYASIFVIIQAIGIFSILDQIKRKKAEYVKKILIKVDECSFGIYLVHMIFVKILLTCMKTSPYEMGGLVMIGIILGIFIVSYAVVWGLKKWTILNKIL